MTAKTPFVIASEARQSGFMGLLQDPPITKQFAQGLFMLPQVHFYAICYYRNYWSWNISGLYHLPGDYYDEIYC